MSAPAANVMRSAARAASTTMKRSAGQDAITNSAFLERGFAAARESSGTSRSLLANHTGRTAKTDAESSIYLASSFRA
ncbi:hypothetical protein SARC_08252 [Sphaeroforma arctica JP610]|uniref:Uncharacterized protein n=1 Tax=Sphaeroforma arctica JP610 TaxID=667725 RepID=A0A0L0FRG1_9EUKA|nr:hypothetical protein SARC_08252 [Sphaeroforma arctica JP610]KNC79360.1 hypothetical protein SARC_08252 [Sphaeroforma arctica JP610]|eukprot:XP_014153262.1 hypothetical protein SARC_08252 [Sphaeroforma arctica JP610]